MAKAREFTRFDSRTAEAILMNVLGVSCYYHDSAAVLVQDGKMVAAAQEERFTRKKHDAGFPDRAIDFCLTRGGISAGAVDYVAFYEKPLLKFERLLRSSFGSFPAGWEMFREGVISWWKEKLWVRDQLAEKLQVQPDRVLFVEHHLAHAASAFLCSPFKKSAILTVDGVGEWSTATKGYAETSAENGTAIHLTSELRFPHSLGLLYSAFTAFLGFEVNEGEYKVMGLAPYGAPRYLDKIHRIARLAPDGSLELDLRYFRHHLSVRQSFSDKFAEVFGRPRSPDSDFVLDDADASSSSVQRDRHYADIAASIQSFTEEVVLAMACHLRHETGLDSLCMAGGVALNSVVNGRILRERIFDHVFIQPAAGDAGGALGAALYVWNVALNQPRTYQMDHAYLGEEFGSEAITSALSPSGLRFDRAPSERALVEQVAIELARGKVVGWFQGRFEWGPRALGNRSILADPRRAEMKSIINRKIKYREPFRPFAPVVKEADAAKFFQGGECSVLEHPARFMLLVLPWTGGWAERVPAVNHFGTARPQTVQKKWNPLYYDLLEQFANETGVPILLNTSFNLRGEPIVASPTDACKTFVNSGIDMLVAGDCVVKKP
jgi:carbamoyltransferase